LFGPVGTPPEVVKKLNEESNKYLSTAEAKAKWAAEGITLTPGSPQDLAALLARDGKRWADVVAARKIVEE
jgi:tripartite-type tricarboxylate transporter receptor subunit TctC